jgi:hypothetical protein
VVSGRRERRGPSRPSASIAALPRHGWTAALPIEALRIEALPI